MTHKAASDELLQAFQWAGLGEKMKIIARAVETRGRFLESIAKARVNFRCPSINMGWAEDRGYSFEAVVNEEAKSAKPDTAAGGLKKDRLDAQTGRSGKGSGQ